MVKQPHTQTHEKEYHMPCYIMPQLKFSDADGYPDRKVHKMALERLEVFIKCMN